VAQGRRGPTETSPMPTTPDHVGSAERPIDYGTAELVIRKSEVSNGSSLGRNGDTTAILLASHLIETEEMLGVAI